MLVPAPTIEQCFDFIKQHEMLDNIQAHSIKVAQVASALLDGLEQAQKTTHPLPDKPTVLAGALLHDIAKTQCLQTGGHHAKEGQKICNCLGYSAIGELVAEHVVLSEFRADLYRKGIFGAKELVYYADKRVRHNKVVPLTARLEYILDRYGENDPTKEQYIRLNFNRTIVFEEHLFNYLNFLPDELEDQIIQELFDRP